MLDWIRRRLDVDTKRRLARCRVALRTPTSRLRQLPDFMIIGAQRAGTSSLYRYLAAHQAIRPSLRKETEYFSRERHLSEAWYRSHFPLRWQSGRAFEATPDYLCFPGTAAAIAERLPDLQVVVLLRDPIERAWSHYRHMVRLGFESLDFECALAAEESRIRPDLDALSSGVLDYRPNSFLRFNYVYRGMYAAQLEPWLANFDRGRVHVEFTEDLMADPASALGRVTDFLGVAPLGAGTWGNRSYAAGTPIQVAPVPEASRLDLRGTFAGPNADLAELLGLHQLPWSC